MEGTQNDIFAWSNNLFEDKEEYAIDLFLMNKNGMLYSLNPSPDMKDGLRLKFLDSIMEAVITGAGAGMVVRPYEDTIKGDGTLPWLHLLKIARAHGVVASIDDPERQIDPFIASENDISRQTAILAKFSKSDRTTFYIFKCLDTTKAVRHQKGYVLNAGKMDVFRDDVAFNIPDDNQVLIIGEDIFVFNQGKFEQMFGVRPHQLKVAQEKGAIIDERFKLSMPTIVKEVSLLAQQSDTTVKKLSQVDPHLMTQQDVENVIEEYGIGLMTDDDGNIILMDSADLNKFLDVLLDNYVQGNTGSSYLAKNKKQLEVE